MFTFIESDDYETTDHVYEYNDNPDFIVQAHPCGCYFVAERYERGEDGELIGSYEFGTFDTLHKAQLALIAAHKKASGWERVEV